MGGTTAGFACVCAISACDGPQSALTSAGEDSAHVSMLFITMLTGAALIWTALASVFALAVFRRPKSVQARSLRWLIGVAGILFPTVVLGALLAWGLSTLPDHRQPGDGLTIHVTAEQWWWRVDYGLADGTVISSANEIRLPVGERVDFRLGARRVIHSFWIPALGGKMDMFPGRETRLSLKAEVPGTYRGQCAEFCGTSHAWMAFRVVAMPRDEFLAWLDHEADEATAPRDDMAARGARVFDREGCGACHTVRGTENVGRVGPDLTHVGSRSSLAAGRLGTSPRDFAAWIAKPGDFKPGVTMPSYGHLEGEDLLSLASYLKALK
jgi:cytochrome c oxidase subunit 2